MSFELCFCCVLVDDGCYSFEVRGRWVGWGGGRGDDGCFVSQLIVLWESVR